MRGARRAERPRAARTGRARMTPAFFWLGALALLASAAWWWTHPPDAAADLRARASELARLERAPADDLGPRLERWRMIGANGDTTSALWRPAAGASATGGDSAWVVVILGGIGTDDRSVLLVPDSLEVGVLAVSWPWSGPRKMGRLAFLARVPALREALLRTPAGLAAGVAAARRSSPGARVALLGASLGVPPTAAAAALAHPDAMVLVDGAADLARLLRSEVARTLGGAAGAALAPFAGSLGGRLLSSLEPARHAAGARHLPVLLIDAEREDRYPPACVASLHAAYPHARNATHPGAHLRPEHRDEVEAIVGAAWRWLSELPVRPAAAEPVAEPAAERAFRERRAALVDAIAAGGVRDSATLAALRAVPRHEFVPRGQAARAYADEALPIGLGQTISQPTIVAIMTEALRPRPGLRVLEVGTGSGYQAAVLAAAGCRVHSIEILPPLADSARARLARLGYRVEVRAGDGYAGWPEAAPFDAIIVTAAPERVPQPLLDQLAPGGRLVAPVGEEGAVQELRLLEKDARGRVRVTKLLPVRFVPMRGEAAR